jgi:hypothetical protein
VPITKARVPAPHLERRVRSRDDDTSWAAAAGIDLAGMTRLKLSILRILTDRGPLTDEAIFVEYVKRGYPRRTSQRVRTARHEMTKFEHRVIGTGKSDRLDSGYVGQKWERI